MMITDDIVEAIDPGGVITLKRKVCQNKPSKEECNKFNLINNKIRVKKLN